MWRSKEGRMDMRRSPWILGVVLACLAIVCTPAEADKPNFTEEQKIDFLQHAKVVASKPEKKGKSDALHLTLSDGKVTYDASFQPIDERKMQGPGPRGGMELNFRDYWGYNIAGYRVAKLLGLDDMVPVYTERSWNGTKGAISWRVADVQFDEADRYNQKIQPPDRRKSIVSPFLRHMKLYVVKRKTPVKTGIRTRGLELQKSSVSSLAQR